MLNGATFGPGEVRQAFSFPKGIAAVQAPHNSNLNSADFTFEAWVNLQANGDNTIATKFDPQKVRTGIQRNGYQILVYRTGKVWVQLVTGGFNTSETIISNASVPLGVWTHLAVVREGNQVRIYINGSLGSGSI